MTIKHWLTLALCVITTSLTQAEVTVTNSTAAVTARTTGTAGVTTYNATIADWSLNGGNTIAVLFTAEATNSFSATFAGVPMNIVEIDNGVAPYHYAAIAYLVDPLTTVGDIEISSLYVGGGGSNRLSTEYSLLSLGGVGSVAGQNVRTSNGDLIYTTSEDGGYVLAVAGNNDYNGPAPTVSGNPDNFLAQGPYDGNHSVIHAHGAIATAGTYSDTYSTGTLAAATLAFNGGGTPPAPLTMSIAPDTSGYAFTWNSLQGKLYDLVSSTDLSTAVSTWSVYDPDGAGTAAPYENIEPTGSITTLSEVPVSDARRFFVLVQKDLVIDQIRVFLVGGQSNADGRADPSGLLVTPVNLQNPQEDVDFYYKVERGTPALTTLRPGLSETNGFGPAITFGRNMADQLDSPVIRVAVIKYANGGTDLQAEWKAGGDNSITGDGPEYQTFQQTVTSGLAALAAAYPNASINIEGMIWSQGETDIDRGYANNYQTNLTNFIADVRATFVANLPFIVVRLSDGQTQLNATGLATVRAAQVAVAGADANADWVNTDGFGMKTDNLHFDAAGQQLIGTAAATSLLNLLP